MAGDFSDTIEKLRSELGTHIASIKADPAWGQVEKIYRALGTIEEIAEVPRTSLAELFGFTDATASAVSVRPGEFIGMDATSAAKAYMEKKKAEAASLDEIMDALQRGGANSVARESLATSLARSTWDVVKAPGQELYRLVKYAPHVKRGSGKKKTSGATTGTSGGEEEQTPDDDATKDSV